VKQFNSLFLEKQIRFEKTTALPLIRFFCFQQLQPANLLAAAGRRYN
jgi:hypothetical protein